MNKEKQKAINELMGKLDKQFGKGVVMKASDAAKAGLLTKKIVSTPSVELNKSLYGGFCGIVELFGPHSSGKTSLAIDTIVKHQKEDPDFQTAWLETEGSISEQILADHGVDLERLTYWEQEAVGNAETALDISRAIINSGAYDLIVLNSVAGLTPTVETDEDLSHNNIGTTAKLLAKYFRNITGSLNKHKMTFLVINQVREKIGQMFGNPETTPGGRSLAFFASQRVRMSKLKIVAADPISEEQGVKIGFSVQKNRQAGVHNPFTKGEYYATFAHGIETIVIIPALAEESGVVKHGGAHWYYTNNAGEELHFKSKNDFLEVLRNDEALRNEILDKIEAKSQTQEEIDEAIRAQNKIDKEGQEIEQNMDEEGDDFVESNE